MVPPTIFSIQVGMPTEMGSENAPDPMDRLWRSGIVKSATNGPVWLGCTNLAGDGQADLEYHGGPNKAVLAYSAEHYSVWRDELELADLPYGAFGENFTVAGLTEQNVCIGDTFSVGAAQVQVSQPRKPCWKLARRWKIHNLTVRVQESGRTGWYFRVLSEGQVRAGDTLILVQRPCPQWTVARANTLMHHRAEDLEAAAELAACPYLSDSWKKTLSARVAKGIAVDDNLRLIGPNEPESQPR